MNWNEAFSEAIQGARITSNTIQEGAYVDYQFDGLRIVYPSGSHSRFRSTDADEAAQWSIIDLSPPSPVPSMASWQAMGRGLREIPPAAPNVGKWGLPRIELGEQGVPIVLDFDSVTTREQEERRARWTREPKQDNLTKLTPFELAQLKAKEAAPVKRDAWGRPIDET